MRINTSTDSFQISAEMLPAWYKDHMSILAAQEKARCKARFNSEFPKILPALGCKVAVEPLQQHLMDHLLTGSCTFMQYSWDTEKKKITWNASNLLASTELAFYEDRVPAEVCLSPA